MADLALRACRASLKTQLALICALCVCLVSFPHSLEPHQTSCVNSALEDARLALIRVVAAHSPEPWRAPLVPQLPGAIATPDPFMVTVQRRESHVQLGTFASVELRTKHCAMPGSILHLDRLTAQSASLVHTLTVPLERLLALIAQLERTTTHQLA